MKKTRTSRSRPIHPGIRFIGIFLLAALGQWLLALREVPATLYLGLGLYALAFYFFRHWLGPANPAPFPARPIPARREALLFLGILLIALFFRLYRLSELPSGLYLDEGCEGWVALRILHEHFRPFFDVLHLAIVSPSVYYWLALWFKFVPPGLHSLFLASVLVALLSFPLIYWTFRQLSGAPTALLSLFLLAVMRWHVAYSRDTHPVVDVPLFMFGTLAFALYGIRSGKGWPLWVSALFFAGGLYSYDAYKAFLLLALIYALWEFFNRSTKKFPRPVAWAASFLLFTLASFPMWVFIARKGAFGNPSNSPSLLPLIRQTGDWLLPLKNLGANLLMYNRTGDSWPLQNIPYHRMLDDGTGLWLVLGFGLALARRGERKYFYGLMGPLIMGLPAILSLAATHASRAFGAAPFLAFLAALALTAALGRLWKEKSIPRPLILAGLGAFLGAVSFLNFRGYFVEQAMDRECWRAPSVEATAVGERIAERGAKGEYFISSALYGHYTIRFLGYFQSEHIHELRLPQGLPAPGSLPPDRELVFALPEGGTGVLSLLKALYPGGEVERILDPWGEPLAYLYTVSPSLLQNRGWEPPGPTYGLMGNYFLSPDLTGPPALTRVDPLINFTFRDDLPTLPFPPLSVRWEGNLIVEEPGHYQFIGLSTDRVLLRLDGKKIFQGSGVPAETYLRKGSHPLVLIFEKDSGVDTALTLAWKRPGKRNFEAVPYGALRRSKR